MPTLAETRIENRWMVQPNHANSLGSVHGGNVRRWMDEARAMAAMRFAGHACVTAHINRLDFRRPIQVGDTALVEAYVYRAGRTSVSVRLQAYREDLRTGERKPTAESYFVYVAIDEDGDATPVPELTVETDRDERLRETALEGEPGGE
ncbi:acyl-CoA thioesterase [Halobacteriales archaeon QS_5_70_15]|nr:MAG: acyl-CoA thioesterase [Halobacteriales archaeon QS_5_70_15]